MPRRALAAVSAGLAAAAAAAPSPIPLDLRDLGVPYEGVGALSGGGGTTRLLIDYPPALQSDIFDALFTPGAGASLQIVKVELAALGVGGVLAELVALPAADFFGLGMASGLQHAASDALAGRRRAKPWRL